MDISILAPSGVKFTMGGAEHLWLGLQRYLNEETSHNCELIKFPSKGGNLMELLQSYLLPLNYDLTHFDQMITGKDPAWFSNHHDHRVYMLHKLRGLYDTYHFFREPESEPPHSPAAVNALSELDALMRSGAGVNQSKLVIERLIRAIYREEISEHELRFPGPFSRSIIHLIDSIALNPKRISLYAAISRTVASRNGYFPNGIDAHVFYPPPRLSGFRCNKGEHFFTVSRLDAPKRIDRIVEEFLALKADVNLFIGGEGPELQNLQQLANGDKRVVFLGKLTDNQILDYYARAIAVPFTPYDEDYGLITVEAMRSRKPVMTFNDCGGVTELVSHGKNGWCVPNERGSLTRAFEDALTDREKAAEMGFAGEVSVRNITWQNLVRGLIDESSGHHKYLIGAISADAPRPRIVVTSTFGIYPPRGGGQSRVYHLYSKIAEVYEIVAVCLVGAHEEFVDHIIAPNFREVRIPKSAEHEAAETELSMSVDWTPVTDIVASELIHLTPKFAESLKIYGTAADAVVLSGPYMFNTVRNELPKALLFYEAHNFELNLKQFILPSTPAGHRMLDTVRKLESDSWSNASLVFACSAQDLELLHNEFGASSAVTIEVSNGFSPSETMYVEPKARESLARSIHPKMDRSAIFLGSWHGPNLSAIESIIKLARNFEDITFIIVGSGCLAFADREIPENVKMAGVVNEQEKSILLGSTSVALNPMTEGSGSNLKMLDYFGSGVPVISTPFGARGIEAEPGVHFIGAAVDDFSIALSQFFINRDAHAAMADKAYTLAVDNYRWDVIGEKLLKTIREIIAMTKEERQ